MQGKYELRDIHKKLLEMLIDLDSFCSENNIQYSLAYGSVLGAVRHSGFIPWDDDLDIYMTRENYNKFLDIYHNNEKYTLQHDRVDYPMYFSKLRLNNTTFIEDIPYKKKYKNIHQGLFIDIFPLERVSNVKSHRMYQNIFSTVLLLQGMHKRGYPRSHMTFKKRIFFLGAILLLPFKNHFEKKIFRYSNMDESDYYCSLMSEIDKVFIKKEDICNITKKIKFEDFDAYVMNNCETYLKNAYGDYMKFPSQEEIDYKIHAKFVDLESDYTNYLK